MEISQDEIFILDPDMVLSQQAGTPPGMPDLVVEQASGISDWWNPALRKRMLSDSGLGTITPHYEDSDLRDLSHSRVLQSRLQVWSMVTDTFFHPVSEVIQFSGMNIRWQYNFKLKGPLGASSSAN
ncbi:diacylglycerol kinase iota-like [Leptonychotes weddellii]|uniref:Diacylglycerol kinase iota-like n=1 Tax=Leptonychotes weddellii TaxID=9713 RepID=A0A7F8RW99_LEPWE|nr:diacylglycerol kinase iota-like [Leptonychotes weddellii]